MNHISTSEVPTFALKTPLSFHLLICTQLLVVALGMIFAFPYYDDTLLRIVQVENEPRMLYTSHGDQPLSGYLWWKLSELNCLWFAGIVANIIGWLVISHFTFRCFLFWSRGHILSAIAASLMSVAPILTEIHFVILSTGILIVGSTAMIYAATYLLLTSTDARAWRILPIAAILAFAGNLFYFYGVPAVAAGATVLCIHGLFSPNQILLKRYCCRAGLLIFFGASGFFTYYLTGDFSWRSGDAGAARVDASHMLSSLNYVLPRLPILLCDGLWKATGGAFFREVGMITWKGMPAMLGIFTGLLMGIAAIFTVRRFSAVNKAIIDGRQAMSFDDLKRMTVYCVPSMIAAMLPILLMGRPIMDETMVSRYTIAMVPFAACMTVALITSFVNARTVTLVTVLIVAVVTGRSVTEAWEISRSRAKMHAWGEQVGKYVDSTGYTLAIVFFKSADADNDADDVLTARFTEGWPTESRRRFWATNAITSRGPHGTTALRGLKRPAKVDRLLFVIVGEEDATIVQADPESLKLLTKQHK